MVVENHPAWPRVPVELQKVDARLTEELNQIPVLAPGLFDVSEILLAQAYICGDDMLRNQSPGTELFHNAIAIVRQGAFQKAGARSEKAFLYRVLASRVVEYDSEPWTGPAAGALPLSGVRAIVLKAQAANYIRADIRSRLLPGYGTNVVENKNQEIIKCFGAKNAAHSLVQAFRFGLFAPDV